MTRKDDLNDEDIMAYSSLNSNGADDDDTPAFSSGGAIMDALE
jgi:hypothetical protein